MAENLKIVVALDSFKGGMSADMACRAVDAGLRDGMPELDVVRKPMADGGEGTAAALLAARPGGEWIRLFVQGPLPRSRAAAGFAWFSVDGTAVIEMAAASGLPLLAENERNPMLAGTYGTGELIQAAVRYGAKQILLSIGGSATVDGGIGAAAALGWRFLDAKGRAVAPVGAGLADIARIVPPKHPTIPPMTVLCDVNNPLCGPRGAAAVFGPQKGATPDMVTRLELGLLNLAGRIKTDLGKDVLDLAGGGAAGGLGAGASVFFNAGLAPGVEPVIEASGLRRALECADWCITGEGSFDNQSLQGKVVSGVAAAARAAEVPVVVFAGQVKASPEDYRSCGIREALPTHAPDMPMEEVFCREKELLRDTAARWLKQLYENGAPSFLKPTITKDPTIIWTRSQVGTALRAVRGVLGEPALPNPMSRSLRER